MDAGGLKERPHFGRVSERGWVFLKGIGTRVGFLEGARKRVASKAGGKQKKIHGVQSKHNKIVYLLQYKAI